MLAATATPAAPERKAGTLDRDVSGGVGLIIGSQKQMTCMFGRPMADNARFISAPFASSALISERQPAARWLGGIAPTTQRFAALSGSYGGASGEATLGVGLGANVLVGGSDQTVALQPISVQGQTGLNLAVGVADLELVPRVKRGGNNDKVKRWLIATS